MEFFYDAPWWLYTVLVAVGLMLAWGGLTRRDRALGVVGTALLVAGVAVFAVSKLVETDREQVARRSTELIKAVERKDWDAAGAFLDPEATVNLLEQKNMCANRAQILTTGKRYTGMVGSLDLGITRLDVPDPAGQALTTEPYVYVNTDKGTQLTGWRFTWHKAPDGKTWIVRTIDLIQMGVNPGTR